MDAIDLLKQDHRKVEELFAAFLQAEDSEEQREQMFQEIQIELSAHAEAEERVFYPAVQAETPEQVDEALREHAQVKEMLAELLEMDFDDDGFDAKFTSLMKAVQHHVDEEEEGPGGIMETARQTLSPEILADIGNEIEAVKREIKGEMAA
jgi:hemerythrin superfamily protein